MGKQFMATVRQQLPLVSDPVINNYITQLGQHLVSFSSKPGLSFHFFIVNDTEINAFAGPGGYIGINSGLILTAKSESELAAVMAHEIAHVTQRHIARSIERERNMKWASLLGVLASISAGTQSTGAAAAIITATQSGVSQSMLGFSRQHEREADSVGREILTAAGYSTQGMTEFMHKLMADHYPSPYEDLVDVLSSHPSSASRAAESLDVTLNSQQKRNNKNDPLFYLIQARISVYSSNNPHQQVKHFRSLISDPAMKNNIVLRYALALALLKNHQLAGAQQSIEKLIDQQPNQRLFQLTAADIALANDQLSRAQHLLEQLYQHYPSYFPIIIQYANYLIKGQQANQAIKILKAAQRKKYPANIQLLKLLAKAQYENGDRAESYQTQAKVLLISGRQQQAMMMLLRAKEHATDPITAARINRQINETHHHGTIKK